MRSIEKKKKKGIITWGMCCTCSNIIGISSPKEMEERCLRSAVVSIIQVCYSGWALRWLHIGYSYGVAENRIARNRLSQSKWRLFGMYLGTFYYLLCRLESDTHFTSMNKSLKVWASTLQMNKTPGWKRSVLACFLHSRWQDPRKSSMDWVRDKSVDSTE